jgi:hypothetical protein
MTAYRGCSQDPELAHGGITPHLVLGFNEKIAVNIVSIRSLSSSVADPDQPDPHVFGPPGSGSISQRY